MNSRKFDEQYERAKKTGEEANKSEPRAESARYDSGTKRIIVRLRTGEDFSFSPEWIPGLRGASPSDLANIKVSPSGAGLHWEPLDEDLSVPALVKGVFGPANESKINLPLTNAIFEDLCAQIEVAWTSHSDATLVDRLATEHPEYSADLYDFFALLIESELSPTEAEEIQKTSEIAGSWLESEGFETVRQIVREQRDETPLTSPNPTNPPANSSQVSVESDSGIEISNPPNNVLPFKSLTKERIGFEEDDINEKIAPIEIVEYVQKQPPGTYEKTRAAIVQKAVFYGIDEEEGNQSINSQPMRLAARRRTNQKSLTLKELIKKISMSAENIKYWLSLAEEDEN